MKTRLVASLPSLLVILLAAGCAQQAVAPSWKYADFKEVGFLWSGDNGSFWDRLSTHGFGTADLLKVVTSPRDQRFQKYGLFNQPGFMRPKQPDP